MQKFFRRLLAHRSVPYILPLVSVLLVLPSLSTGWQQDDLVHRYALLGNPDPTGKTTSPLELFGFFTGDTTVTRALMNTGVVPWWTLPAIRLSFLRPLSSLSHWVDYRLWPDNSGLMHAQNLLWFAGLIGCAVLLYRRLIGAGWVAVLAGLFFALDDAHGLPAGWIANRNALIAGVFGLLALLAHIRWRRGWRPGGVVAPVFLLLALLGGESALAVCGYLLAYAIFVEEGEWKKRWLSLIPSLALAVGWLILYKRLGYGTWGSGFYTDALSEPVRFLAAVAWKSPLLLTDQWGIPPSSLTLFLPQQALLGIVVWGVLFLAFVWWMLIPLLRASRLARFWFTGMLLSIPLVCSTMPHSRLLTFAGIGAFGLLAEWIEGVWEKRAWLPESARWKRAAKVFTPFSLAVHLVIGPVLLSGSSTSAAYLQKYVQDSAVRIPAGPELHDQDLVIVNHPVVFLGQYLKTARYLAGASHPRHLRVLAPGLVPLRVTRLDEKSILIRPEGGFLGQPFDDVFRGAAHPLRFGEKIVLDGMEVEIGPLTLDGRPGEAIFRFAVPLTDPLLRWLRWEGDGYVPFTPPAIGESVTLPAAPPLF